MPHDYKNTDSIHAYLKGKMDKETLSEFERNLASNSELADELQWHKDFQDILLESEKEELTNHVQKLIEEEKRGNTSNDSKVVLLKTFWQSKVRYLAVAALVLLAIGLSFIFLPQSEKPLYAKHLETPYLSSPEQIRGTESLEWIKAYQLKEYNKVIALLLDVEQKDGLKTDQKLYLGLSYLYLNENQTSKAIQYLKATKEQNPILYTEACHWYIALAYLKDGQKELAREYLQEIASTKTWKHQEAKELLEEM